MIKNIKDYKTNVTILYPTPCRNIDSMMKLYISLNFRSTDKEVLEYNSLLMF